MSKKHDYNTPAFLRIGDDSTPQLAKVRVLRGAGSITSKPRDESEAYRKFLSRGTDRT
jgi:hypothetical protein